MARSYTPLGDDELADALRGLPGWGVEEGQLTARWTLPRAVLPTVYREINEAEDEADHHATVTVLHTTLTVAMNTHAAGGAITAYDIALARTIGDLVAAHGGA